MKVIFFRYISFFKNVNQIFTYNLTINGLTKLTPSLHQF